MLHAIIIANIAGPLGRLLKLFGQLNNNAFRPAEVA